jgi:hypothetical protein
LQEEVKIGLLIWFKFFEFEEISFLVGRTPDSIKTNI